MDPIEIQIGGSNEPPVEEYNLTGVSLTPSESAADQLYQHRATACEEASLAHFENEVPSDAATVLSSAHASQRTEEDDYDKMFLLSLLPSFRRVPEHVKLHVRIQMQQVLAAAFHPTNHRTD